MIRYLKHKDIDLKLWDECISLAPQGIIYAYSWYLDLICEGWDALVEDNYTSVMPVTRGRKYLMDYIYPPFFAQQLGVFSKYIITPEMCHAFMDAIPRAYRFVEMNVHISNQWIPEGFKVTPKTDLILSMNRSYESIRGSYSENHSRNLKKAIKNNLILNKNGNPKDVVAMFTKNRGRFITNLQKSDYEVFLELTLTALEKKMGSVWMVSDQYAIPCAGAVFYQSHGKGVFIFSSTTKEGKTLAAMHFLIDAYIREHCTVLNELDFEGSNDPELARFYRGFGSTECVYLQIRKNQLPVPWRWFKN